MADKFLLIAAYHHIITVTQGLRRYTIQNKQLFIHKPDEYSNKNNIRLVAATSSLAVSTNNLIKKMDRGGFLSRGKPVGA